MMGSVQRVAVIGLDGATFDLIEPGVVSGDLPTFQRLIEQGAYGRLRSTIHPLSPQAWTTFMTGKNAGKHGVFDFLMKRPGSYHFILTHGGHRRGATLWQLLSQAGKRCLVINVPFTYPPEHIKGVMISGFDAPRADRSLSAPPEAYEELVHALGEYCLHQMYPIGWRRAEYQAILEWEIANRVRTARYFIEGVNWDFFMLVVNATDLAQHLFWAEWEDPSSLYHNLIPNVYRAVDRALGQLWELLGHDTTLLVISDHGAGPVRRVVNLNRWLYDQGWLTYRKQRVPTQGMLVRSLNAIRRTLKSYLPRTTKDWLKSRLPGLRNQLESYLYTTEIDWGHTRAFAGGKYGNIYINVRGREPEGTVQPGAEYEKLCEEIETALYELRDPELCEPVVERVHRREELYWGPLVELSPDLIIQWKDYAYLTSDTYGRQDNRALFAKPEVMDATMEFVHSGTHRMDGILIAVGPDIRPGGLISGARLMDLAPTILHTFGMPIPADMDGVVLEELLSSKRPVQYIGAETSEAEEAPFDYTEAERAEIAERLRRLGYMD